MTQQERAEAIEDTSHMVWWMGVLVFTEVGWICLPVCWYEKSHDFHVSCVVQLCEGSEAIKC